MRRPKSTCKQPEDTIDKTRPRLGIVEIDQIPDKPRIFCVHPFERYPFLCVSFKISKNTASLCVVIKIMNLILSLLLHVDYIKF